MFFPCGKYETVLMKNHVVLLIPKSCLGIGNSLQGTCNSFHPSTRMTNLFERNSIAG